MNGFVLASKPENITSLSFTQTIARKFNVKRSGHTGTLDKMASGLMIILLDRATVLQRIFLTLPKTYHVLIKLGYVSETVDREGEIKEFNKDKIPDIKEVKNILESFKGVYIQEVPPLSAKKFKGRPFYWYYYRGKDVPVRKQEVMVYEIDLIRYSYPFVEFSTKVSSGTYVRSLVKDIGEKLSTGAYINKLIRTGVGEFKIEEADEKVRNLSELKKYFPYVEVESRKEIERKLERDYKLVYIKDELIGFLYRDKDKVRMRFL